MFSSQFYMSASDHCQDELCLDKDEFCLDRAPRRRHAFGIRITTGIFRLEPGRRAQAESDLVTKKLVLLFH
jgi:hypothetical protein